MDRYALVDKNGTTVNVILWDGVADYTPPDGCSIVPEDQAQAYDPAPAEPQSPILSTLDFFNRFTDTEKAAVWVAAGSNPLIGVGLTHGLAAGEVNLTDSTMADFMSALVSAGVIDKTRQARILTP